MKLGYAIESRCHPLVLAAVRTIQPMSPPGGDLFIMTASVKSVSYLQANLPARVQEASWRCMRPALYAQFDGDPPSTIAHDQTSSLCFPKDS